MKKFLCLSLVLPSFLVGSVLAQPLPLPQSNYVCHVVTRDGLDGLVFIQANSIARARIVAAESRAYVRTVAGATAETAVECQLRSGAEFASDAANALLQDIPL